jgi:hypothetical protein
MPTFACLAIAVKGLEKNMANACPVHPMFWQDLHRIPTQFLIQSHPGLIDKFVVKTPLGRPFMS